MVCIYCSAPTRVTNSRTSRVRLSTWRRRSCTKCRALFTTREIADLENSLRVSSPSKALEPFRRDKVFLCLYHSMSHRKTALTDSTGLTDTIIAKVVPRHTNGLISTSEIAVIISEVLIKFDSAAHAYYTAHYSK